MHTHMTDTEKEALAFVRSQPIEEILDNYLLTYPTVRNLHTIRSAIQAGLDDVTIAEQLDRAWSMQRCIALTVLPDLRRAAMIPT